MLFLFYVMHILELRDLSNHMNDAEDFKTVQKLLNRLKKEEIEELRNYLQNTVDGVPKNEIEDNHVIEKTSATSYEEHQEWFAPVDKFVKFGGLDQKYPSKESFFEKMLENRVTKYYKKFFKDLEKDLNSGQKSVKRVEVFKRFCEIFKDDEEKEKRKYFDRSKPNVRMCTELGEFICKKWGEAGEEPRSPCGKNHLVNPYKCREQRLLFSCKFRKVSRWSLDHM